MQKHTVESLTRLITKRIEPPIAERILEALRLIEGQLITTRILDKLPGGRVEWRLTRNMGWTEIKNRSYLTSQGSSPDGVALMLARSESSVPLLADWVERENPAYFAGRRERNALRAQALADTPMLARMAALMNDIENLLAQLAVAKCEFDVMVAHGTPLSPDHYELERACGLRTDKR